MKIKGLGKKIKFRRKELKLTARELAHTAGIDRTYISKIENTNLLPAYHVLIKLENALGIDLNECYRMLGLYKPNMILLQSPDSVATTKAEIPLINKSHIINLLSCFNHYITQKNKPSLEEVAFDFVGRFIPEKRNDEVLLNAVASLIADLEIFQARTASPTPHK